jgi:hypothetical protein
VLFTNNLIYKFIPGRFSTPGFDATQDTAGQIKKKCLFFSLLVFFTNNLIYELNGLKSYGSGEENKTTPLKKILLYLSNKITA